MKTNSEKIPAPPSSHGEEEKFHLLNLTIGLIGRYKTREDLAGRMGQILVQEGGFHGILIFLDKGNGLQHARAIGFDGWGADIEKTINYPTPCVERVKKAGKMVIQPITEHDCVNCQVPHRIASCSSSINLPLQHDETRLGYMIAFINEPAQNQKDFIQSIGQEFSYALYLLDKEREFKESQDQPQASGKTNPSTNIDNAFLSMMSHELRSSLNGIIGTADLLLCRDLPPDIRESIKVILESGNFLLRLFNDFLDLNRIGSKQFRITPRPVNLGEALIGLNRELEMEAAHRKLELTFEVTVSNSTYNLDWMRLRQVLANLVANAIKFTEPGGHIHVRVEESAATQLEFVVEDNGIGIDLTAHRELFKPFQQAHGSLSVIKGGSGLGLSICKQLVELWGGRIHVDSKPGLGSRFTFTLPLRSAPD